MAEPAEPTSPPAIISDGDVSLCASTQDEDPLRFTVTAQGAAVGLVEVRDAGDGVGELTWQTEVSFRQQGFATRAVRLAVTYAFTELGHARVQAQVDAGNHAALRIAARAGLRREGILRGRRTIDGERQDLIVLARLAGDPEPQTPAGFIGLVNASLPRTRLIAHIVIRDRAGRVLLCETTYKTDWELPGGVVEPAESPRDGATREAWEELGAHLPLGRLLSVDWLPPWRGWDDAVELLFDGGVYDTEDLARFTLRAAEIRQVEFCTLEQVRERCLPGTYRRLAAVLDAPDGQVLYLERGAPPGSDLTDLT
ncbi:NUDIX hydrolase [Actinopolymorpha alba]|uniref:NUDIX hydrolase n=1 Tax=Actinopolymorpha alba TaxID=533267 RepID=UPI00035CE18E|nr:NUDIX hydrolase [Actinopolymorpha alba]